MKKLVKTLSFLLLIVFISAFFFSPLSLATVTSESMEPTLTEGNVYLVVPGTGLNDGDIITFYSNEKEEYVTHRIVGQTSEGFITQGDNNQVTDQSTGHPYVTEESTRGEVVQFRGGPVTLNIATELRVIQNNRFPILAILVILLGISIIKEKSKPELRNSKTRIPKRLKYEDILLGVILLAIVFTMLVILLSASTTTHTIVVTQSGPTATGFTVAPNQLINLSVNITPPTRTSQATHHLPTVSGATLIDTSMSNGKIETVTLNAGPYTTTGVERISVSTYAYPAMLPRGLLTHIHNISPILAAFVCSIVLWGPLGAIMILVVPSETRTRFITIAGLKRLIR